MFSLFSSHDPIYIAISAIILICLVKLGLLYIPRTSERSFSQFFLIPLSDIRETEGFSALMKIANNALTYSIILIVVFYIILYTAASNAYPNEDGAIVEAAYPVINTKGDERATDNDTIEIKPSPEMAKTISLEAAPAAKSKENEAATTGFVKKAEAAHLGAARVVHISAPAVKPVRKKIERRIEKVSTGTATVPNRRKLSDTEMFLIMTMVKERCFTLGLKSNCVRIIKTKASNIDNAFALAPYFQKNGYVIAGREERSLEETGIRVDVEGIIFKVIVGKN